MIARTRLRSLAVVLLMTPAAAPAATAQRPQPHQQATLRKFDPPYELPHGVRIDADLVYASPGGRDLHLDLFSPTDQHGPIPVVVFIQGSGYNGNNKVHLWREAAELARRGFATLAIEHRGVGRDTARWPAPLEDAEAALEWVGREASRRRLDLQRVAAVGISSGAHVAALLGSTRGGGEWSGRLRGVVVINGPLDLVYFGENRVWSDDYRVWLDSSVFAPLLGGTYRERPDSWRLASPLSYVHSAAVPALIIHGTADGTLPIAQARRYYDIAHAAGVPVEFVPIEGGTHEMTNAARYHEVLELIASFLQRILRD